MTRLPRLAAVAALCAAAGACAESLDQPMSSSFGRAVASMDAQIIPAPPATDEPATTPASRAVIATRRYERDRPLPPQTASTSDHAGYSNSNGGGGDVSSRQGDTP